MSANKPADGKKILIPVLAVIAVGLVVFLTNRPAKTVNDIQVVDNEGQYNEALGKVIQTTQAVIAKFNAGEELEPPERETALQGAKAFDKMNTFRPNMSAGFFEAGLLYYLGGDTDTAISRFNEAIADESQPANLQHGNKDSLNGVIADCHHMLSLIAFDRHDYNSAVNEVNVALTLITNRESYYIARAQAEVQLNWNAEANRDVELALKLNPNYLPATRLAGFLKHLSPSDQTSKKQN